MNKFVQLLHLNLFMFANDPLHSKKILAGSMQYFFSQSVIRDFIK